MGHRHQCPVEIVLSKDQTAALPNHLSDPEIINNNFLDVPGSNQVSISQLTYFEHNKFIESSLQLKPTTPDKVLKALRQLKSSAKGSDGINLDMIMLTLPHSLEVITCIINTSITTSTFPDIWKIAVNLFRRYQTQHVQGSSANQHTALPLQDFGKNNL